jgi:hypothetical protein
MVTALDGNTAGELGIKLVQLFGPSIVGVVAAMDSNDLSKVAEQATVFFAKLTPAEFTSIKRQLLKGAQAKTPDGEFIEVNDQFTGEAFSGEVGSLMALVAFALKLNFANFFEGLGIKSDTIAKLKAKATKATAKISG